jgi:hypothetical protein
MPGPIPGIHVPQIAPVLEVDAWMAGTSPAMTFFLKRADPGSWPEVGG